MKINFGLITLVAIVIGSTAIMTSCNNQDLEKQVEVLEDEVIGIHDEVMPEMSTIAELQRQIEDLLTGADSIADATVRERLYSLRVDLERADEGMMDWMAEYQLVDDMQPDSALQYLEKELEKVNKVKDDMISSIKNARDYIQNLSSANE
jgi:hypothetical protein